MKLYPESALRRAMKVLAVILKAMARAIKWIQAADILYSFAVKRWHRLLACAIAG